MLDSKEKYQAFQLGCFAGELLMSKGVIQPDFQFNNIGIRNGKPVLLDYADIITVNLPAELTKDSVRTIKESLFSLADNYEGSFEHNSYLRAGFLARTGMLGHMFYTDARDKRCAGCLWKNGMHAHLQYLRRHWRVEFVMEDLIFLVQRILLRLFWCFRLKMKTINLWSFRTFGFRRIP